MTSAHFIYIPMVLVVGIIIGVFLGGRAARDAYELQRKREEERAVRKAARAEKSPEAPQRRSDDPEP